MTPEREAALETLPPEVASEKEWQIYRMRNDSFIVDLFQGQYRNRLECLTCHKVSVRRVEGASLKLDIDHVRHVHVPFAACAHEQEQGCGTGAH